MRLNRKGELLLTRERGRKIAEGLPREPSLILDFQGVKVASPSFLDELLRGAANSGITVAVENASPQIRRNLKQLARINAERDALEA